MLTLRSPAGISRNIDDMVKFQFEQIVWFLWFYFVYYLNIEFSYSVQVSLSMSDHEMVNDYVNNLTN